MGVDAVDVARFRVVLARRPALVPRLFTDGEQDYAARSSDPGLRLAARFAAKEAVLKALGSGIGAAALRDIEVERLPSGRPSVRLHRTAAALAGRRGVRRWHLSLSHTGTVAIATVVAEGGSAP